MLKAETFEFLHEIHECDLQMFKEQECKEKNIHFVPINGA